ncbi:hypothetical protein LTR84_008267 [Exophiala bonariae]|uniref:Uncharacterized protein n=1 Tax=Exophiala bonariae TaxID=1690606 RepID=A0AAV9MXN9_9EURO|nr:hypothetical protein LTR84_008267 [Exophiala bonariae]
MGILKTAMMSGAAMYGIKQVAKAAESHGSNNKNSMSSRRDYSDRDYDQYYSRPDENSNRQMNHRYLPQARDMQDRTQYNPAYSNNESRQRIYLEDQAYNTGLQYSDQEWTENRPQYAYATNMRSASAPPPQYTRQNQNRQQGFVEPEEMMDDPRDLQGGNRADMMNMLAQQAMSMGLMGGKSGQKDKKGKGNLIRDLMSK